MSASPAEFPEHVHEWTLDTGTCADCGVHRAFGGLGCDHLWDVAHDSQWAACIWCGLMIVRNVDTPPDAEVVAG